MFVLYACYVYLCICTKSTTTWVIVDLCACVRGHACDTPVACMYAQMQVPRMGNLCTHVGLSQALALNTKYSEWGKVKHSNTLNLNADATRQPWKVSGCGGGWSKSIPGLSRGAEELHGAPDALGKALRSGSTFSYSFIEFFWGTSGWWDLEILHAGALIAGKAYHGSQSQCSSPLEWIVGRSAGIKGTDLLLEMLHDEVIWRDVPNTKTCALGGGGSTISASRHARDCGGNTTRTPNCARQFTAWMGVSVASVPMIALLGEVYLLCGLGLSTLCNGLVYCFAWAG